MSSSICDQCGFENDPTRVFCQNCGHRLTPPAGEAPTAGNLFIPPVEADPVSQGKPKRRVSSDEISAIRPRGSVFRQIVGLIVWAFLFASIIQAVRKPDDIPVHVAANPAAAGDLFKIVSSAAESRAQRTLAITPLQINNYLSTRVVPLAEDEKAAWQAKFVRMFITLGNNNYRLLIEQRIFDWPIYIYLEQEPVISGGVSVKSIGGGIGRLPIHPLLLPVVERLLTPEPVKNIDALTYLQKASGVTIRPDLVTFVWAGKGQP